LGKWKNHFHQNLRVNQADIWHGDTEGSEEYFLFYKIFEVAKALTWKIEKSFSPKVIGQSG
jgi:hypothetical protein